MSPIEAISSVLGQYVTFSGRATRSEYWWYYLFTLILSTIPTILLGDLLGASLSIGVSLVLFLPSIAVGCRRLHDIGKSGWWLLLGLTGIGIIPVIIWLATKSEVFSNKYGPAPQR